MGQFLLGESGNTVYFCFQDNKKTAKKLLSLSPVSLVESQ